MGGDCFCVKYLNFDYNKTFTKKVEILYLFSTGI